MRLRRVVALAGAALLVAGAGVWWRARRLPDVVVIVADTLRADRVGSYGNPRGLTPFLDELAAGGTRFARAYATSSWTNPSVASLFTSRFPSQHGVGRYDSRVPAGDVTLAERLTDAGYLCYGFSANLRLTEALGFSQGFLAWFPFVDTDKVRVDRVVQSALSFLDEFHVSPRAHRFWRRWFRRPLFLYVQLMEPHAPYLPPQPWRDRFGLPPPPGTTDLDVNAKLVDWQRWSEIGNADVALLASLYDGEVAALDAGLRPLFDGLRERGFLDEHIVIVTADHGEEFREHGLFVHGTSLYDEAVRVPLLWQGTRTARGAVVDQPVSLVDVAPTLLAVLGLAPETGFEGRSLAPQLGGAPGVARDVLAELLPTMQTADPERHDAALVRWPAKVLLPRQPRGQPPRAPELYDLADDPGEHHDRPAALLPEEAALLADLRTTLADLKTRASPPEQGAVAPDVLERLRALGYAH